jgi:hypothetical protein
MTTDADRKFSRSCAEAIYQNYMTSPNRPYRDNVEFGYREALYRGLLAECDFALRFGARVRGEVLNFGDGGVDFYLPFKTCGGVQCFPIDVKSKSVPYGGWDGWQRMIVAGTHLRVPVREVVPGTIYVLGIYLVGDDVAFVDRWAWGSTLIRRNERMRFENGNDEDSYTIPYGECRELQELKDRLATSAEALAAVTV